MGMDVGSSSGAMATPNIVPLIDILLVLIIIFMVITPLTPKGMDTLVPQPSPNQQHQQNIDQRDHIHFGNDPTPAHNKAHAHESPRDSKLPCEEDSHIPA